MEDIGEGTNCYILIEGRKEGKERESNKDREGRGKKAEGRMDGSYY